MSGHVTTSMCVYVWQYKTLLQEGVSHEVHFYQPQKELQKLQVYTSLTQIYQITHNTGNSMLPKANIFGSAAT